MLGHVALPRFVLGDISATQVVEAAWPSTPDQTPEATRELRVVGNRVLAEYSEANHRYAMESSLMN